MAARTPKIDHDRRLAQLDALRSRLKGRVSDILTNEGELTVNELAEQLGAKPSALYRHLEHLVEVGLVEECEPVRTGKNFARVFRSAVEDVTLAPQFGTDEERDAIGAVIESQLRHAGKEVRLGLESESGDVGTGSGIGWLTRAERERVDRLMREAAQIYRDSAPGRGRTLQAYTYACRPVDHELTKRAK